MSETRGPGGRDSALGRGDQGRLRQGKVDHRVPADTHLQQGLNRSHRVFLRQLGGPVAGDGLGAQCLGEVLHDQAALVEGLSRSGVGDGDGSGVPHRPIREGQGLEHGLGRADGIEQRILAGVRRQGLGRSQGDRCILIVEPAKQRLLEVLGTGSPGVGQRRSVLRAEILRHRQARRLGLEERRKPQPDRKAKLLVGLERPFAATHRHQFVEIRPVHFLSDETLGVGPEPDIGERRPPAGPVTRRGSSTSAASWKNIAAAGHCSSADRFWMLWAARLRSLDRGVLFYNVLQVRQRLRITDLPQLPG